ncbi:MAG: LacI family DNA-binding transcriptional regulator [Phycisphaerae bacterium]
MATLREIAREANVSVGTVSSVLNGKLKENRPSSRSNAARIRAIADELGYRPNAAARAMRSRRTWQIGVLIRNDSDDPLTHPALFETIMGINQSLEAAGLVVSLIRAHDLSRSERPLKKASVRPSADAGGLSASRALREQMLDGMLVLSEIPVELVDPIAAAVPHVVWVESGNWADQGHLRRDERRSGRLCAQNLIKLGYRELVFLDLWPWDERPAVKQNYFRQLLPSYSHIDRLAGVSEVAAEADVPLRTHRMTYGDPVSERAAPSLMRTLRPDVGVIAPQAYQARWFAHRVAEDGMTAPRDFGLCCCDDSHDLGSMWPALSRVSFDRYGLGKLAAEMMLRALHEPDSDNPSRVVRGEWLPGKTARKLNT